MEKYRKTLNKWKEFSLEKKWQTIENIGKNRNKREFPQNYKNASVGIIFREGRENDLELLFIKRTEKEGDPWSGHVSFPGGRMEDRDATYLDTAIREVREEVGLDLSKVAENIGRLETVQAVSRGKPLPLLIHPFLFRITGELPGQLPFDRREVETPFWVPLSFFLDRDNLGEFIYTREELEISLPCYCPYSYKIWGLTLGMIEEIIGPILKMVNGE